MEQKKKYIPSEWEGKRYGHLTIIGYSNKMFDCICDCGNKKRVKPTILFRGKVKTCGVNCQYHNEQYDLRSKERLYPTWSGMMSRCYNPKVKGYYLYGGRGIAVCDEWKNDFWAFNKWGLENGFQDGLSIDRIDGNGNYEPNNCRWATDQQQRDNSAARYTYKGKPTEKKFSKAKKYHVFGEELSLPEIAYKYGVSTPFLRYRLKAGLTIEEAITLPKYFKGED